MSKNNSLDWLFSYLCFFFFALDSFGAIAELSLSHDQIQQALGPRRLTLLIGVKDFRDSRYPALQFPHKDVEDVHNFFATHNHLSHDQDIMVLSDRATQAGIKAAFDQLERSNLSEKDMVIVYVSSHGTLAYDHEQQLQRYVVLNDSLFDNPKDTAMPVDYLESRLARLRSQKKALILALCHSGNGKSALPGPINRELKTMKGVFYTKPFHEVSEAMMVLSASSWGQPAREDQTLKNDIYTHFLLEGLDRNDTNDDGAISLFEAHEYARSQTYDFTRGSQTPSALVNVLGMDPLILNGSIKKPGNPLIVANSDLFRNLRVEVNGKSKGSLWQPVKVETGRVRLALIDPERPRSPLVDHYLYLSPETTYSVHDIITRKPTYQFDAVVSLLPITPTIDQLNSQDLMALGVEIASNDILGLPYGGAITLQTYKREYSKSFDDIRSPIHLNAEIMQVSFSTYLEFDRNWRGILKGGIERAHMRRLVDNDSFLQRDQTMTMVYPTFTTAMRYILPWEPLHIGFHVQFYPGFIAAYRRDDQTSLRTAGFGIFTGATY